ncbi:MAG TPA: tRNA preQ1(34) S-adenosylmethionine ribosyltransferase-isomerase QueA [Blastocatellia bacterium]|nr:tRNA preQ1(34) S-adenosylmethionine ribosyltransferase-isomerase QueA [Blastocatellia bacterium]
MLVSDFDFALPESLIAQEPAARRDLSRLLVVDRAAGTFGDSTFAQLPDRLSPGDVLVLNNTRVFPARLIGRRLRTTLRGETVLGGRVEIFLVRQLEPLVWEALVHPGKALLPGVRVEISRGKLTAEVVEWRELGRRVVRFEAAEDFDQLVDRIGRTPLPRYIKRSEEDRLDAERYQTVFASRRGAVAAPTAGLHFTEELLDRTRERGVVVVEITLHVGYGTFQPVRVERVEDHLVSAETYLISDEAAEQINRALIERRRVVAVGTTSTRALESAALQNEGVVEGHGINEETAAFARQLSQPPSPLISPGTATTDLFIYPGFSFRVVGGLVTNFHLPRSSLLMLVSAFAGRELILEAYRHAVRNEYRFYSYGDAMLIL